MAKQNPKLTDDDVGEISVSINGRKLRTWDYTTHPYSTVSERGRKMKLAREYIEGWCEAMASMEVV